MLVQTLTSTTPMEKLSEATDADPPVSTSGACRWCVCVRVVRTKALAAKKLWLAAMGGCRWLHLVVLQQSAS